MHARRHIDDVNGDDDVSEERSSVRAAFTTEETGALDEAPRVAIRYADGYELLVLNANDVSTLKLSANREYTIGRDSTCDIVIDDTTVSRFHARLSVKGDVSLVDLGSSNGTSVGGRRLAKHERSKLVVGAIVEVGQTGLVLQPARPNASMQEREHGRVRRITSISAGSGFSRIVVDPAMQELYGTLDVVAPSQIAVLILGETGVGKEVIASEVHRRSRRADAPFVAMNCAALPDSILEAELFGYERGAFTGANQAKVGLFEAAHGGTVFLDEIGDMPISTQAKVLRVLESGEILRLGSVKARTVDVRFVAATNRDIPRMIEAGQFRADLYFRLNGVTLSVPPLRRRRTEIVPLAKMFVEYSARRHGRSIPELAPDAVERLVEMPWPGNVRQLRNTIERAVVMCNGSALHASHLGLEALDSRMPESQPQLLEPSSLSHDVNMTQPLNCDEFEMRVVSRSPEGRSLSTIPPAPPSSSSTNLPAELKALERERIVEALNRFAGNQSQAARHLKMSRTTLISRIREYNLARPRQR